MSPRGLSKQVNAISTWKEVADLIVSVNTRDEAEMIQSEVYMPHVVFMPPAETGECEYGKPYPSIDSIVGALMSTTQPDDICVICNSDIIVKPSLKSYLQISDFRTLLFSNRKDIGGDTFPEIYLEGIDLFAWQSRYTSDLIPNPGNFIGVPFWDISFPFQALRAGFSLVRLPFGLTSHIRHEINWSSSYESAGIQSIQSTLGTDFSKFIEIILDAGANPASDERYITGYYTNVLLAIINLFSYDIDSNSKDMPDVRIYKEFKGISAVFIMLLKKKGLQLFLHPQLAWMQGLHLRASYLSAMLEEFFLSTLTSASNDLDDNVFAANALETIIERLLDGIELQERFGFERALATSASVSRVLCATFLPKLDIFYGSQREVTGFTSLYNSGKYIPSLVSNVADYEHAGRIDWLILDCNGLESPADFSQITSMLSNLDLNGPHRVRVSALKYGYDPGLYGSWINSIAISSSPYLTNINSDDIRSPVHIATCVEALEDNPTASLACTALKVTYTPCISWQDVSNDIVWYSDIEKTTIELVDMFQTKTWDDSTSIGPIASRNLPHCMPVWRRTLHSRHGYFNESEYSSVADWEFWLRCLKNNEKFVLINDPLGAYFWNRTSYNRVDHRLERAEIKILNKYVTSAVFKHLDYSQSDEAAIRYNDFMKPCDGSSFPIVNIIDISSSGYGDHRTGWKFAVDSIGFIHSESSELSLLSFVEKKFAWGLDPGDINNNPTPITKPWIGCFHVPPHVPFWFQQHLRIDKIFSSEIWRDSLPHLKAVITLTQYHANHLKLIPSFKGIPIYTIYHPTSFDVPKFNLDSYLSSSPRGVVQVGVWLRKLHSIGMLDLDARFSRMMTVKDYQQEMLNAEAWAFGLEGEELLKNVIRISFLPDDEYDQMLAKSIVYCDFYDTSANNVVLECIARATPLVVPRHPALEEYLGIDYPLFFSSQPEAKHLIEDDQKIIDGHYYLSNMLPLGRFSKDHFVSSIHHITRRTLAGIQA